MTFTVNTGNPTPFGFQKEGNNSNFAIFSKSAKKVSLAIFSKDTLFIEFPLNKTGDVWHVSIRDLPERFSYAFKVDRNEWVSDPYFQEKSSFNWEGVKSPKILWKDLIIYEMHVRGFTMDPSSKVKYPGTFLGIIEKIPYLKKLGINAVELMPIFAFDTDNSYWGYDPLSFFSAEPRYLVESINEFKALVKEFHKNGIEVILDVVYNHTSKSAPFPLIDKTTYYMIDEGGEYRNFSGCGNTMNCNHPIVQQLIVDSLTFWIEEMHVDGFRIDLASIFSRGEDGEVMENPPLLEAITKLSSQKEVKLIAEPWDACGLNQVGFFQNMGENWIEWNDQFRDGMRNFIKGEKTNFNALFLEDRCIHYITCHDGFTLYDLVSYEKKNNFENGEENRDGCNSNFSWNCGIEGDTNNFQIKALRERQMRNFLLILILSKGVPMLLMGDEYGHTRKGNNNPNALDNRINWFCWDSYQKNKKVFDFVSSLISIRKKFPLDWELFSENSLVSKDLFLAFNPTDTKISHLLPKGNWEILIQTENDWHQKIRNNMTHKNISLVPYSSVLARSI